MRRESGKGYGGRTTRITFKENVKRRVALTCTPDNRLKEWRETQEGVCDSGGGKVT